MGGVLWWLILDSPVIWLSILIALTALLLRGSMRSLQSNSKGIYSDSKMTGSTAAEAILSETGLYDVQIKCMDIKKGDHYNSLEKTIYLTNETYYGSSLYDLASAAHQCGHAKQHSEDYCSMHVRFILVTVLSIISFLGLLLLFFGIVNQSSANTIQLAAVMMVGAIAFQLISLPIEFNASQRGMDSLMKYNLIPEYEKEYCRKGLRAAALTYLASSAMVAEWVLKLAVRR